MYINICRAGGILLLSFFLSCKGDISPEPKMISLLAAISKSEQVKENPFESKAKMVFFDSLLRQANSPRDSFSASYSIATVSLQLGDESKTIEILEDMLKKLSPSDGRIWKMMMKDLGMAWLRKGEKMNCIKSHSSESCIFPIAGQGIHSDPMASQRAIDVFEKLLQKDTADLEARWLLNIAYMTTGEYPRLVPAAYLLKGLDSSGSEDVLPFTDLAIRTGLNTNNLAGGSIVEDFNNDNRLDLVTSSWNLKDGMHYCQNLGNGNFSDKSDSSGLRKLTGGLNIVQTDYNNDGLKDIFVLRGAWKQEFGKEPNSLLRNNGDGSFTDVTHESGLLSFHPTQTCTWADFNNDGWLDVFIGNESMAMKSYHPCELYMNDGKGHFTNVATAAGCDIAAFVKGVNSGDFNNDGLTDLFLSTMNGKKFLLKNMGVQNGVVRFQDISQPAGFHKNIFRSFSTWFWDYDNDGWLDILVSGYHMDNSLASYAAAEALGRPLGNTGKVFVYKNNRDETFTDISKELGLDRIVFAMGSNFGDIDNDGFLDMYFGTGNPDYTSLIPNKLFKNVRGKKFIDITRASRTGNLQKGHGVSFADMDNDGDEDIYVEMGGAYDGDAYQNSLYLNPGQNNNNWINVTLEGTKANRPAIGARIRVDFVENGTRRSVFRVVCSGSSFGANPLTQHIGIGQSALVESIEIKWPGSNTVQHFKNINAGENIKIREGDAVVKKIYLSKLNFARPSLVSIGCAPY